MPIDFNRQVIEEFRANGGRVGGPIEGGRLLLLTTTGARSGAPHTTPLGYLPDGDGRVLVIASAGGAPKHPAWYHNLVAHPRVTVEAGVFAYEAQAVVLEGAERDRAFARAVDSDPGWSEYQEKTDRVLPVVALAEIPAGPPNINASSAGGALKAVHDGFRRELALIRKEIVASGPGLGAQLRVNCLTLCQGLTNHTTPVRAPECFRCSAGTIPNSHRPLSDFRRNTRNSRSSSPPYRKSSPPRTRIRSKCSPKSSASQRRWKTISPMRRSS